MKHALKFTLAAVVTVLLCITIGAQERERGSAQRAPAGCDSVVSKPRASAAQYCGNQ